MDYVFGCEFSFVDGFAVKPVRTFVVNTNAPLHSNGFEVPPSGGVATFPSSGSYVDRCIVWRAIGQKLYLEERSVLYTITGGSLCIDFARTPILPGTSITISEDNVLCILVPTASTIHRFYASLRDASSHDTFSLLARIREDEMIRRFHTSHVLTTSGRAMRASATNHSDRNTIAYCTAEGQLVVVTMNAFTEQTEKHEEIVFGDNGFFQRLLASPGSRSNLFSDAVVMKHLASTRPQTSRKSGSAGKNADLVFAVTRDGWIQAWNVETRKQLPGSLDLKKYQVTDTDDEQDGGDGEKEPRHEQVYTIRGYAIFSGILLCVACDTIRDGKSISSAVHLVKVTEGEMLHLKVFETCLVNEERLVDMGLLITEIPDQESQFPIEFCLTTMFRSSSAVKAYSLKRISFSIDWPKNSVRILFGWHDVRQFCASSGDQGYAERSASDGGENVTKPYNLSPDSSIDDLTDVVFDIELHSFDVVSRAVQIVTDNYRGSFGAIKYGNWSDLGKLVETYLLSVEFNRKFQMRTERSIRLRLNSAQETQVMAQKNFWWALLSACEELSFAARGAIAIAPMQVECDVKVMMVIHKDRVTVLGDNSAEMMNALREEFEQSDLAREECVPPEGLVTVFEEAGKLADQRIVLMNRERVRSANARKGNVLADDELIENGYDYENDGCRLLVHPSLHAAIIRFAGLLIEASNYDNSKPYGAPCSCIYGGSFTGSLVAANIRVAVEKRLHSALCVRALINSIKRSDGGGNARYNEIGALKCELREIIRIYRELIEQLDLKIEKNGAKLSLCSWLTSSQESLDIIRKEGGYGKDEDGQNDAGFNVFIGITTEAAIRALLSTSEVLLLFRRLVTQKEFKMLLNILNGYINETSSLKPAINFYRGIAYSGTDHPVRALSAFNSTLDAFVDGNIALRRTVLQLLPRAFVVADGKDALAEIGVSEFYLTVVRFLQEHGHTEEVMSVAINTIESQNVEDASVQLISNTLFNHLTARKQWFNALKLVLRTTLDAATRRASICELLTLMLSQGEWEAIATMAFGVYEQVVEEFLRDAASRQSANEKRHIYELLFAYYVARKDYRMAACSMYEYAKHIESCSQMTGELLKRKRNALAAVLNMQSVLSIGGDEKVVYDDADDTNLVLPVMVDEVDTNIESCSSGGMQQEDWKKRSRKRVIVLTEREIRNEWVICAARVHLLSSDLYEGIPPSDPRELLAALTDSWLFDAAFDVAKQFTLDPYRIFFTVSREAIMIDALRDEANIEMVATQLGGWVRTNRRHCVAVSSDDHWAVVRGLVEAARSEWPGDSRVMRGAVEAFLSYQLDVPFWLHSIYEKHDPNDYLRCLVDYGNYKNALKVVVDIVDKQCSMINGPETKTWIPYGIIEELLQFSANDRDCETGNLRETVREKFAVYFKKIASFEKAQQMSMKFF